MEKYQKTLLIFAVIGTLALFVLAAIDQFLFDFSGQSTGAVIETEAEAPSSDDGELEPATEAAPSTSEDNESKPETEEVASPSADAVTFQISPAQSEARFTLGELLGGEPTTVVGKTNVVSGSFDLAIGNPQSAVFGEILIDARGLTTDNSFRNRALQGQILNTDTYPTISFVPEEATPLPAEVNFGEEISLEISGALTIKDVTQTVTFNTQITPISETEIIGHAETMINRADYGITIPSVPRVADVDEEVLLEFDFVALADE